MEQMQADGDGTQDVKAKENWVLQQVGEGLSLHPIARSRPPQLLEMHNEKSKADDPSNAFSLSGNQTDSIIAATAELSCVAGLPVGD